MNRTATRTTASVAGSLLLAAALAGCGGSSAAPPLTASQFKSKADAICKAKHSAEQAAGTAIQTAIGAGDQAAADKASKDLSAVIRTEAKGVAALKPPASMKSDVKAFLRSLNASLDLIDSDGLKALSQENALTDAAAKATALGLTQCGSSK